MKHPLLATLLLLTVVGCAARPGMEILAPTAAAPATDPVAVYVATTRQRQSPDTNSFTNRRSPELNLAEYRVSVPPAHVAGRIEWPRTTPADPAVAFAPVEDRVLTRPAFDAAIGNSGCGQPGANTVIFVHGYNTSFPEALFRVVQMVVDTNRSAVPILFAWPSDANAFGYVADRDSAIFSRDALTDLLAGVTRLCGAGQVTLIGHSMGAWLTVEALRQLRLAGRDDVLARLQVALASPDIDVEVFQAQMRVIGRLNPPMTVLVSRDDRALSMSGRIAGARRRLGELDVDDPKVQEAARTTNLTLIDISGVSASDGFNHDRYVNFAGIYARLAAEGVVDRGGGLRRAGAFVFNTVGSAVSSPFRLAGRALSPD